MLINGKIILFSISKLIKVSIFDSESQKIYSMANIFKIFLAYNMIEELLIILFGSFQ